MSKIPPFLSKEIKEILESADACIILTGAGMGVDSGLSVFRGDKGLWEKFPKAKELNFSFEDLANPMKYLNHKDIVIPFYLERFRSYKNAEPHDGYYDLIEYASKMKKGCFAVTSNVDGFFQKAYLDKDKVYEIHGSINKWQCSNFKCAKEQGIDGLIELSLDDLELDEEIILTEDLETKLSCPHCRSLLRPNLLMFYDMDWFDKEYTNQSILFDQFAYSLYDSKVAIIEIGAGEKIRSIKTKAEDLAYDLRTKVIRINPEISIEDNTSDKILCIKESGMKGISDILSLLEN